jgi:hypothetical protein
VSIGIQLEHFQHGVIHRLAFAIENPSGNRYMHALRMWFGHARMEQAFEGVVVLFGA